MGKNNNNTSLRRATLKRIQSNMNCSQLLILFSDKRQLHSLSLPISVFTWLFLVGDEDGRSSGKICRVNRLRVYVYWPAKERKLDAITLEVFLAAFINSALSLALIVRLVFLFLRFILFACFVSKKIGWHPPVVGISSQHTRPMLRLFPVRFLLLLSKSSFLLVRAILNGQTFSLGGCMCAGQHSLGVV